MKFTPISKGGSEFECPLCKSLNNIFIGMEKVDASSKKSIEE
jgi:phage FluMu protein Com